MEFTLQLMNRKIEFSAFGLFVLNKGMLLAVYTLLQGGICCSIDDRYVFADDGSNHYVLSHTCGI